MILQSPLTATYSGTLRPSPCWGCKETTTPAAGLVQAGCSPTAPALGTRRHPLGKQQGQPLRKGAKRGLSLTHIPSLHRRTLLTWTEAEGAPPLPTALQEGEDAVHLPGETCWTAGAPRHTGRGSRRGALISSLPLSSRELQQGGMQRPGPASPQSPGTELIGLGSKVSSSQHTARASTVVTWSPAAQHHFPPPAHLGASSHCLPP